MLIFYVIYWWWWLFSETVGARRRDVLICGSEFMGFVVRNYKSPLIPIGVWINPIWIHLKRIAGTNKKQQNLFIFFFINSMTKIMMTSLWQPETGNIYMRKCQMAERHSDNIFRKKIHVFYSFAFGTITFPTRSRGVEGMCWFLFGCGLAKNKSIFLWNTSILFQSFTFTLGSKDSAGRIGAQLRD